MEKLGKQLKFLSQINRDGSGTKEVSKEYIELMRDDKFNVICLSLSEQTFIAHGFNSFVVRFKRGIKGLKKKKFKKLVFTDNTKD